MFLLKKVYSKEDGGYLYGYDLDRETYLDCRFVVTDLNLEALSSSEAVKELFSYSGTVHKFETKLDLVKMLEGNPKGGKINRLQ